MNTEQFIQQYSSQHKNDIKPTSLEKKFNWIYRHPGIGRVVP